MRQLYLTVALPKITYGIDIWYIPPSKPAGYTKNTAQSEYYATFKSYFLSTIPLDSIQDNYAIQQAVNLSTATNLPSFMSVSPQTVISPVSYTIVNVAPFNQPVYDFLPLHPIISFFCIASRYKSCNCSLGVLFYCLFLPFGMSSSAQLKETNQRLLQPFYSHFKVFLSKSILPFKYGADQK